MAVWSGCEMTWFCYITGETIIYSVHNTTLNRLDFGMLTVATAIFHWLNFDQMC